MPAAAEVPGDANMVTSAGRARPLRCVCESPAATPIPGTHTPVATGVVAAPAARAEMPSSALYVLTGCRLLRYPRAVARTCASTRATNRRDSDARYPAATAAPNWVSCRPADST